MSVKVFLLSFTGILMLYMLRSGYSFSKPYLREQYKLSSYYISLMDALIFLGVGIGFMLRYYFAGSGHPIKILRNNGLMMCLFYLCIPMLPILHKQRSQNVQTLLLGILFVFGFLQHYFLPALKKQMQKFYTNETDECAFSCWFTSAHLGKICGFAFMTLTVIGIKMPWQASLILLAFLMVGYIAVVYYQLVTREVELLREMGVENAEMHGDIPESDAITLAQFIEFSKLCFRTSEMQLYILLACCYKSMHQNFVLWLPTYLFSHNYKQLAGQITLAFVIPIFAGSFLVGKMYEHSKNKEQTFTYASIFLATTALMTVGGLILLSTINMNYIQFVMVTFLEGVVIGGFFNVLRSSQPIIYKFDSRTKEMMWTLIQGSTNISTGVVTLIIGFLMRYREQNKIVGVEESIFIVLQIVAIGSVILLIVWIVFMSMKLEGENEESDSDYIDV